MLHFTGYFPTSSPGRFSLPKGKAPWGVRGWLFSRFLITPVIFICPPSSRGKSFYYPLKENEIFTYQDMFACYSCESVYLSPRSRHIPGYNLHISVYDFAFRCHRVWCTLTTHPRNPNYYSLKMTTGEQEY